MEKSITIPTIKLELSPQWQDYQLLDSGHGKTLERFGSHKLIRPEPQVIWQRSLPKIEWDTADAVVQEAQTEYGGQWHLLKPIEKQWAMQYKSLKFQVQLSSSRHVGVFPEQASHWDWISNQIKHTDKPLNVLNLFGYTGLATLAALQAGAKVTHVDSSKHAISWANYNLKLSGLSDKPVRWIVEDALKFTQREARRGNRYDGLILDPPKFGRGSDGKIWDFYKSMPELLEACRGILSEDAQFIVLTAYAIQASAIITAQALQEILKDRAGYLTTGELVTREESAGHIISHALFSRWTSRKPD